MAESVHPARLGYRLEGLPLKDGGVTLRDIIEHFGFTHKIARIDPVTVPVGLLLEREDLVRIEIELQGAELTTGFVGRKGKEAARRLVSLQGITDVQVGDTVSTIVTFQFSEWLSRMVVVLLERSTVISLL